MIARFHSVLRSFITVVVVVASAGQGALATMQTNGVIAGVAKIDGKPISNVVVRLRNVDSGELIGSSAASPAGEFSFSGLTPGNYLVEMVSANGTIIGTSVTISLTTALMASTNIVVGASAAAVAAAGGATASGAAIGTAAAGASGLSATVIAVSAVATTLGTTAIVAVGNDASPSR